MFKALLRGVLNRCPACGQGRIFASMVRMNEHCNHCEVPFQPYEGDFLGAVAIAYTITAVAALGGYLVLSHFVHWSTTVQVVLWSIFSLLFYIGFYRNMKGIWVGILYLMTGLKKHL